MWPPTREDPFYRVTSHTAKKRNENDAPKRTQQEWDELVLKIKNAQVESYCIANYKTLPTPGLDGQPDTAIPWKSQLRPRRGA